MFPLPRRIQCSSTPRTSPGADSATPSTRWSRLDSVRGRYNDTACYEYRRRPLVSTLTRRCCLRLSLSVSLTEMLIFSFGSGFTLESADPTYLSTIKGQIDYAHSRGIEVGGYDLICLDRGNPGKPYGEDWSCKGDEGEACFASGWYDKLSSLVHNFVNETGLSMLETDGPYGGSKCESHNHSHHDGLEDSVYRQTQLQSKFYADMRRLNVYINQPDSYFFQGGSRWGWGTTSSSTRCRGGGTCRCREWGCTTTCTRIFLRRAGCSCRSRTVSVSQHCTVVSAPAPAQCMP